MGEEATKPVERFRALDAWRGIAALVVANGHFGTTGWIGGGPLAEHPGRLVDFFFVLSGFVIAHAYRDRLASGEVRPFLLRRVGRLWPLHLATLAAVVAMAVAGSLIGLSVRGWTWESLPAAATLTHAWGLFRGDVWNLPSWSISTEVLAYLVFALFAARLPGRLLDLACALIVAACFAILLIAAPRGFFSTHDYGLARCLCGFFAGVLAHTLWRSGARPKGEIAAVAATMFAIIYLPPEAGWFVVPLFVWVVLVFASEAGPVSVWLTRRFPQMLGTVSYSIYLVHYPIGVALMTLLFIGTDLTAEVEGNGMVVATWWICDALSVGFLAAVMLISRLTYAWIERPGRAFFNGLGEKVPAAW